MSRIAKIMTAAREEGTVIPAFNIPYLPMMEPVVQALKDTASFGMITVARLEWVKFESGSIEAVAGEYLRIGDGKHSSLHLDHIPVIDEDRLLVDYMADIRSAIQSGFSSVMIDGSRLVLEENIGAVRNVVEMAHCQDIPVEAELGSVLGHESGGIPDYEELYSSGKGFTDIEEAKRFITETEVDWLSVAVGSVHGAITAARKEKKIAARINMDHLGALDAVLGVPLVLHGGSGIPVTYLKESFLHGISKINIATDIRQPYERFKEQSRIKAQEAVYEKVLQIIHTLGIQDSANIFKGA